LTKLSIDVKTHSPDCSGNPFLRGLTELIMTKRDAKKIVSESGIKLKKMNDLHKKNGKVISRFDLYLDISISTLRSILL